MDFFLPWWLGHIPGWQCQHSSGSGCERVEHEDTSVRVHEEFHTWIGHHRVLTLPPFKYLGCAGKDWRNGWTLLSSIQNLGQKWMQLWMEINVVKCCIRLLKQCQSKYKRQSNKILATSSVECSWEWELNFLSRILLIMLFIKYSIA